MPFAIHRGQRIHYSVEGSGPLLILQHGLFLDALSWKRAGFVDALSGKFRVVCIDSLGHGHSDKPSDRALYGLQQRSGDIIAVIDDLGAERAHLVGHSMGGWLAVGVARHHPGRLSSLVVGGWDPINGLPPGPAGPVTFDSLFRFCKRTTPALVEWITPEIEPGVRACFAALGQLEGAREAVLGADFPVMIWEGRDDPNHDARKNFATANGLQFLSTAGDHLGMIFSHGAEGARGIGKFLERV